LARREFGELAVDRCRPVSCGDGDVPPIGAGDEIERGERRRARLDAGKWPLVVIGFFLFQRRDLAVNARAIGFDRLDLAHGHWRGAACEGEASHQQKQPQRIYRPPSPRGD
jgi:hypothetical protein